jgi:murein DD-endopeptidase MepM/ murein hydrolase activator NlpD
MVRLIDPFPGAYDASDPYGNSAPPRTQAHTGSDWPMPNGTPIPAISSGLCVYTGFNAGTGNCIVVRMSNGLYWAYLHMSEPAYVAQGADVQLGDIVGSVGDTGTASRGSHLHITMSDAPTAYVGGGNTFDPFAYIMANLSGGNLRIVPVASGGYRLHRVAS